MEASEHIRVPADEREGTTVSWSSGSDADSTFVDDLKDCIQDFGNTTRDNSRHG